MVALKHDLHMNAWTNEGTRSTCCWCTLWMVAIDGVLCASAVLGLIVSDIQSGTKAVIRAVSLRPIHWHSFIATSTHTKRFLLSFLPPLKPSRGKSVKLEVDVDKSTKGSNFAPSEVAIGLSPYTFPHECPFHVPGEENVVWAGVRLQDCCPPISSSATEIRALQWTWR